MSRHFSKSTIILVAVCSLPVLGYLAALISKEVELSGPNVAKSPNRRYYAEVLEGGQIRVDRLPCGNALAGPPVIQVAGNIKSVRWGDDQNLIVVLASNSRVVEDGSSKAGIRTRFVTEGKDAPSDPSKA